MADGADLGSDAVAHTRSRTHLRSHEPVTVITEAQPSYDDAFRARRKRYVIMMAMRLPCLVLAAVFYRTPWLAVLIILLSIPLPWIAVLIANDGPARKRKKLVGSAGMVGNTQRALAPATVDVIDDTSAERERSD